IQRAAILSEAVRFQYRLARGTEADDLQLHRTARLSHETGILEPRSRSQPSLQRFPAAETNVIGEAAQQSPAVAEACYLSIGSTGGIGQGDAERSSRCSVARLHDRAERRSDERQLKMPTGRVKFFNTDRGFGFILPDDGGPDVFVHAHEVEAAGMKMLVADQLVVYELGPARDGRLKAV